jgi:SAM-dependent methyltransferase
MCHTSVIDWAATALTAEHITDADVLEVGSYDINGTVRAGIEALSPASYLGADIAAGPGVDLVASATELPDLFPDGFDLVVTTEMLEHVEDWRATMVALAQLVKPGGTLALSTRSPGFPYPVDNWRYPVATMHEILTALGLHVNVCIPDPEVPGVFAIAQKPERWTLPEAALDSITIPGP